jgi:hypothetical protein
MNPPSISKMTDQLVTPHQHKFIFLLGISVSSIINKVRADKDGAEMTKIIFIILIYLLFV